MKRLILLFIYTMLIIKIQASDVENIYEFCKNNNYNTEYCILVDFSKSSASSRFMVYNFTKGKSVLKCKCASGKNKNEFSNKIGSNLSSLGKYKIGKRRILRNVNGFGDISKWKIPCYELHGLDKSNSNAYKRGILIHPDPLLFNIPIPILLPNHSQGCFSIPESSFAELDTLLSKSKKPVLLVAFR